MSTPQQRVEEDLKQSMKARDAERTSTLRMLLAALKNERISLGHEVNEEEFVTVVQRGVKQRQDSVEQYRKGGREVRAAVEAVVREQGLAGPKAIGQVMSAVMPRFKGRFDGKALQQIAREALGA